MSETPDHDMTGEVESGLGEEELQEEQQESQVQQQLPPKRTRVLLSCAPCRISKLKCDREVPCGNCLKKDRVDLCEYAPRPKKPTKPAKGMAARLRRLEGMLREIIDVESAGGGSATASAAAAMSKFGVSSSDLLGGMELQLPLVSNDGTSDENMLKEVPKPTESANNQQGGRVVRGQKATTYVGATHFMAMLDDIDDLKAYFEDPQDDGGEDDAGLETSAEFEGTENLMMGAGGAPPGRLRTKSDLLRMLPPRSIADRLITRFFNSHTPSHHVLHRPTFTRQYKAFWSDMANVDNAFLAVIFVILELGVHFSTFSAPQELDMDGVDMSPVERYRAYRAAASCALTLTKFTNPSTATLQAMVIFIEAEFLVNRVSQTNCFLLLGVCIRIMLKMGLHRDPSRLPNISAFEGEIRRRLWNLAIQLDLIVSFYLGLPSMIHGIPSDTSVVHNLLDDDFNEDSAALPPSRPDTEYTAMSYTIFKSMVCRVFGQVARLAHTLAPPAYSEIMRTDRLLEDTWRGVPAFIKVRPVDDCVADPPLLVVQRFGIASLYQRSRCVLHRPYLLENTFLPEHAYSRRACLQSALALLEYHRAVHEATQPGAVLHQIGWFITGLGMHDFLLAAMIVYIVVQNESKFEPELLAAPCLYSTTSPSGSSAPTVSSATATTSSKTISSADSQDTPDRPLPANYGSHAVLPVERRVLVDLLRRSYEIWAEVAEQKSDAVKAAELVGVMLRKIYASDVANGRPPKWSPPVDARDQKTKSQHSQQTTESQSQTYSHPTVSPEDAGYTLQTGYFEPAGLMPLSEANLPNLGIEATTYMPPVGMPAGTQMDFAPDLQTQTQPHTLPLQTTDTGTMAPEMPTRYDAWIPLNLGDINWNTVDTGIRVSSQQTNEWTTADSVLTDINYAASSLWDSL